VSGLNIELPPLRERADKIQLFSKINQMYKEQHQPAQLSPRVIELFYNHPWPGNVRQLVSVIQIALAMCDEGMIQEWHLPDDFFADLNMTPSLPANTLLQTNLRSLASQEPESDPLNETIRVYNDTHQNISKTARLLSVSRNTVYKRLKNADVIK